MSLLKHEPSAQRPWAKTMLGLVCVDMVPPPTHAGFAGSAEHRMWRARVWYDAKATISDAKFVRRSGCEARAGAAPRRSRTPTGRRIECVVPPDGGNGAKGGTSAV